MRLMSRTLLGSALFTLAIAACGTAPDAASSGSAPAGGAVLTGVGGGAGSGGMGGAGPGATTGSGDQGGGGSAVKLGPPYPIVLAHGFFGFEKFAGQDFLTYFYGVKQTLEDEGEIVFTPSVDPFNSSDFRGAQLAERIEEIVAKTGYAKVNIIGHSQGGLDARVAANLRPDLVASVVTVATPHGGSPIADVVLGLVDDPNAQGVIGDLFKLIGAPLYDEIGNETDVILPLQLFSKPGIAAFNKAHPDSPGVFYASVAGRTDLHIGGDACDADVALPFITDWADTLDTTDPLMSLCEGILDGGFGDPYPNDGLVRVVDSKRGQFWGCLPTDHLDEVGQLFGDGAGIGNKWNHAAFYSAVVAELRKRGF
jgi:triacylglycerol lipase